MMTWHVRKILKLDSLNLALIKNVNKYNYTYKKGPRVTQCFFTSKLIKDANKYNLSIYLYH